VIIASSSQYRVTLNNSASVCVLNVHEIKYNIIALALCVSCPIT